MKNLYLSPGSVDARNILDISWFNIDTGLLTCGDEGDQQILKIKG